MAGVQEALRVFRDSEGMISTVRTALQTAVAGAGVSALGRAMADGKASNTLKGATHTLGKLQKAIKCLEFLQDTVHDISGSIRSKKAPDVHYIPRASALRLSSKESEQRRQVMSGSASIFKKREQNDPTDDQMQLMMKRAQIYAQRNDANPVLPFKENGNPKRAGQNYMMRIDPAVFRAGLDNKIPPVMYGSTTHELQNSIVNRLASLYAQSPVYRAAIVAQGMKYNWADLCIRAIQKAIAARNKR